MHRVSGYLLVAFSVIVWLRGRKSAHPQTRLAFHMVIGAMALQLVVGIITVLNAAPVQIALTHQALAVILWVLILRARYLSAYPIATSIRGT
jgi:cytochrome c oxidase assembly protein subunit 15